MQGTVLGLHPALCSRPPPFSCSNSPRCPGQSQGGNQVSPWMTMTPILCCCLLDTVRCWAESRGLGRAAALQTVSEDRLLFLGLLWPRVHGPEQGQHSHPGSVALQSLAQVCQLSCAHGSGLVLSHCHWSLWPVWAVHPSYTAQVANDTKVS